MNQNSFNTLKLPAAILKTLEELKYHDMTPIQAAALPHILQKKDLIARAKTGSGKTAAFGIGVVAALKGGRADPQALILCPTRELAEQVGRELRRLARAIPNIKLLLLCGGTPMRPQSASLEYGAHIIVGTPGRVLAHLQNGTLSFKKLTTLVLDEADRMLDMGFYDDIKKIIDTTPPSRQSLLFSATFPDTIKELSSSFQSKPVQVEADTEHEAGVIRQHFFKTSEKNKSESLLKLLDHFRPENAIVFCNTKIACRRTADYLNGLGFHAIDIHGDLEQRERTEALVQFTNKSCSILVATDVAARGLDVPELQAVISYDLANDPEVHLHRIGRTGRSGKKGVALTLATEQDAQKLDTLAAFLNRNLEFMEQDELDETTSYNHKPPMLTLCIDGGRKQKVRPGDILGALTKDAGLPGDAIGKIDIFDFQAYVAVRRNLGEEALQALRNGKIKGRRFRIWSME